MPPSPRVHTMAAMPDGVTRARSTYPALAAWRAELRTGSRTPTTFDPLWRAACAEAAAAESEGAGLSRLARSWRRVALVTLRAARKASR